MQVPGPGGSVSGSGSSRTAEYRSELSEALEALGLEVDVGGSGLVADGTSVDLEVFERAHPHPGVVAELVGQSAEPALLVADRISEAARQVLRDAGWSWLDRRGHLRIWIPQLRVDAPIGVGHGDARGTGNSPWTPVGLEIAVHALINPDVEVSARRIAADTGRSPGGTQEILGRFMAEGLIGSASRLPLLPDLFWETSSHWPDDGWLPLTVDIVEAARVAGPESWCASMSGLRPSVAPASLLPRTYRRAATWASRGYVVSAPCSRATPNRPRS